jgi:hypothetical protein
MLHWAALFLPDDFLIIPMLRELYNSILFIPAAAVPIYGEMFYLAPLKGIILLQCVSSVTRMISFEA